MTKRIFMSGVYVGLFAIMATLAATQALAGILCRKFGFDGREGWDRG